VREENGVHRLFVTEGEQRSACFRFDLAQIIKSGG